MNPSRPTRAMTPPATPGSRLKDHKQSSPSSSISSSTKQSGQASVLIEYFERSTLPKSEQTPNFRLKLRPSGDTERATANDKSDGFEKADSLKGGLGNCSSVQATRQFPSTQSLASPSVASIRPLEVRSQQNRSTQSSGMSSTLPFRDASEDVGNRNEDSNLLAVREKEKPQDNEKSANIHRHLSVNSDILDSIVSNVIRRLILPELQSIRTLNAAPSTVATSGSDLRVPESTADIVHQSPVQATAVTDLQSSTPMDLTNTHNLSDSEIATGAKSISASVPSSPISEHQLQLLSTHSSQIGETDMSLSKSEVQHSRQSVGAISSDSEPSAWYMSTEEFLASATSTDLDSVSDVSLARPPTILYDGDVGDPASFSDSDINQVSPSAADIHHERKPSDFSFVSGPESPLNVVAPGSSAIKNIPRSDAQDTRGAIGTFDGQYLGPNPASQASSPLGIRLEDSQTPPVPWLRTHDTRLPAARDHPSLDGAYSAVPSTSSHRDASWALDSPIVMQDSIPRPSKTKQREHVNPDETYRHQSEDDGPRSASREFQTPPPHRQANARTVEHSSVGSVSLRKTKVNVSPKSDGLTSQYMATLIDRLVLHDVERNAREADILRSIAHLADDLRNGLEGIKHTIVGESQFNIDQINRGISLEISRLRGPRAYESQKLPENNDWSPKRNFLMKALAGIKTNSDMQRVEHLLQQILSQVEHLDAKHQPLEYKPPGEAYQQGLSHPEQRRPDPRKDEKDKERNKHRSMGIPGPDDLPIQSLEGADSIKVTKRRLQRDASKEPAGSPKSYNIESEVFYSGLRNMTPLQREIEIRRLENERSWKSEQDRLNAVMTRPRKSAKDRWMQPPALDSESEFTATQDELDMDRAMLSRHDAIPKLKLTTTSGHSTKPSQDDSTGTMLFGQPAPISSEPSRNKLNQLKAMFRRRRRSVSVPKLIVSPPVPASFQKLPSPELLYDLRDVPEPSPEHARRQRPSRQGSMPLITPPRLSEHRHGLSPPASHVSPGRPSSTPASNQMASPEPRLTTALPRSQSEYSLETWIDDHVLHELKKGKRPAGPRPVSYGSVVNSAGAASPGGRRSRLAAQRSVASSDLEGGKVGGAIRI